MAKSTDGGATWSVSDTGLSNNYVIALVIDPINSSTVYAGTLNGGVFKSTDGGASWSGFNTGLSNLNVHALAVDPSGAFVHAGTGAGVFDYQYSAICADSLSATSQSFEANGGAGSVEITAGSECSWSATSYASWITITSSSSTGSGNGTVSYFVAANGTLPRTGILSIAARSLSITQAGAPVTITSASVAGKKLFVSGENFDPGAVILLNGEEQVTKNDAANPKNDLIGKKAGKKIKPGDKLQVRNPNGTISLEFSFSG